MKMIRNVLPALILIIACVMLAGCKSKEMSVKEQERLLSLLKGIDQQEFVFTPTYASPFGSGYVNLNGIYSVEVTKEQVTAYLPYFGTAYMSPMDPRDLAVEFTSKNYDYDIVKKKNKWNVIISTKDTKNKSILIFSISNSGYADLQVQEINKQAMGYYGTVTSEQ